MSRFDEDFQAKPVDPPPHYHWGAVGPVQAAPVTVDGEVAGYLFVALDEEQNSAGLIAAMGRGFAPSAQRSWSRAFEALAARGVPAAQAFEALLGSTAPDGMSVAGTAVRQFADKSLIADELNPERVQAREAATATDRRAAPSRAEIDDALRRGAPLTARVRDPRDRLTAATPAEAQLVATDVPALTRLGARADRIVAAFHRLIPESPTTRFHASAGEFALVVDPEIRYRIDDDGEVFTVERVVRGRRGLISGRTMKERSSASSSATPWAVAASPPACSAVHRGTSSLRMTNSVSSSAGVTGGG